MFHFTDVPMIISGGYILILDPRQELLPRNKHFKRKAGVKVPLASAHRHFKDQLVPFDGIYSYSKDHEYYEGTIFRFPFRSPLTVDASQKALKSSYGSYGNAEIQTARITTDSTKTRELLKNYFEDALIALLFLRNVRKIEFLIRDDPLPKWSVIASRSESASDEIFQEVTISTSQGDKMVWHTGLIDIEHRPNDIIKPGRGALKITKCGVAACISHPEATQKVFCRLPTAFKSYIPISFHASFAITGDRQSIPFEFNPRDREIAKWNHWLLDTCISGLYLEFLKVLVPKIGELSFKFWPTTRIHERTCFMSDVVAKWFWNKVMDEEHKHWPLYPLVNSKLIKNSTPLVSRSRKSRRLYSTTSSKTAQFDLLPHNVSTKLRNLFTAVCPTLVCPPEKLQSEIKKLETLDLQQLNSDYLCQLFREESNCDQLARFLADIKSETRLETIEMFLDILVPLSKENTTTLNLLDGCKVLPLVDGSLGTLHLNPTAGSKWYFYATEEEQKLFSFAGSLFVETRLFQRNSVSLSTSTLSDESATAFRNPITAIMEASFNIRKLEFKDIGALIEQSQSPAASGLESEARCSWTVALWLYLNKKIKQEPGVSFVGSNFVIILSLYGLDNQPIYQVRSGKQWRHITPSEFEVGAYILDPRDKQQCELCKEIKDLEIVNNACVPSLLSRAESSLGYAQCFIRWLQALTKIETRTGTPISKFLADQLTSTSIKVNRQSLDFLPN